MTEDECTVMVVAENRDRNGAQEQGHRPTTACMIAVPQRSGRGRQRVRKRHRLRTTRRDAMQQGEWMHEHEAQAGALSVRHSSVLLRERTHSSHVLQEGVHPKPSPHQAAAYTQQTTPRTSIDAPVLPTHVLRPRTYDAASKYSIQHVVRNELSYTPLVPLQRLASPLTKLAPSSSFEPIAPPRASKHASLAHNRIEKPSKDKESKKKEKQQERRKIEGNTTEEGRKERHAHLSSLSSSSSSHPSSIPFPFAFAFFISPALPPSPPPIPPLHNREALNVKINAQPLPTADSQTQHGWARLRRRASTAAAPAGTSRPARGTSVRVSDPACPWVGREQAQGCRAVRRAETWRPCCIGVHIAAGGRHVDEDGGGTSARAGAGIDSGGDGILVDLDLGRRRTGLGAVVGTGRCGGQGGRICLRRQRGARGRAVDPSKMRQDEQEG
ncbi:hypothetical protein B0H13DRAFT_2276488 [Mycena leptocephala]|nr:hypothetical protein B0H13DRAFT_2276488 [Mycena leptocephala]